MESLFHRIKRTLIRQKKHLKYIQHPSTVKHDAMFQYQFSTDCYWLILWRYGIIVITIDTCAWLISVENIFSTFSWNSGADLEKMFSLYYMQSDVLQIQFLQPHTSMTTVFEGIIVYIIMWKLQYFKEFSTNPVL